MSDITVKEEVLTPETVGGLRVEKVGQRSQFMNIMIYGDPGVGKTVLAGSADAVPEMRPVLFVDVEGGTESLRNTYPDVKVIRVLNWSDMQSVYDELHAGRTEYRTVVLDSLTEIQKFNMYGIMSSLKLSRPDLDEDIPGMREWGKNIEQMRKMVRAFRDLKVNTIFTALKTSDRDARSGITWMKPSMSGKLKDEIAGFLDVVAYYYVKLVDGEQQRLLLTSATESQVAKDRSGKLPQVLREPTMTEIWNLMTTKEA